MTNTFVDLSYAATAFSAEGPVKKAVAKMYRGSFHPSSSSSVAGLVGAVAPAEDHRVSG